MSVFFSALLLLPLAFSDVAPACWSEAAQRYRIPVELLRAVARVESNFEPSAVNRAHQSSTGTYDIGLMQINSSHLPALRRYGYVEADLLHPCVNLHIGAWLLASIFTREGMTWDAVGTYNAACTRLRGEACRAARARYAWRVYRQLSPDRASPASGRRREVNVSAASESASHPSRLPSRLRPRLPSHAPSLRPSRLPSRFPSRLAPLLELGTSPSRRLIVRRRRSSAPGTAPLTAPDAAPGAAPSMGPATASGTASTAPPTPFPAQSVCAEITPSIPTRSREFARAAMAQANAAKAYAQAEVGVEAVMEVEAEPANVFPRMPRRQKPG